MADIRQEFRLSREEAERIATGLWLQKIEDGDKYFDGLKKLEPAQLQKLADDPKNKDFYELRGIAQYAYPTRKRSSMEVETEIMKLEEELDIDLTYLRLNSGNLAELKKAVGMGTEELGDKLDDAEHAFFDESYSDEEVGEIRKGLRKIIDYAEKPVLNGRTQEQIDAKIIELQGKSEVDLGGLRGKSGAELARLAVEDEDFGDDEAFQELLAYANQQVPVSKVDIDKRIEAVKKAYRERAEQEGKYVWSSVVSGAPELRDDKSLTLGGVEAGVAQLAGRRFQAYQDSTKGLTSEEVTALLTPSGELKDAELKAKRDAQLAALKTAPDPNKKRNSGIGEEISEGVGGWLDKGGEWLQSIGGPIGEWFKEHPDVAKWGGVAGIGAAFMAMGSVVKKAVNIPVIGSLLGGLFSIVGAIGLLWGGLNLAMNAFGFNKGKGGGGEHGHGILDPYKTVSSPDVDVSVQLLDREVLKSTNQAMDKIKTIDPELHKKLSDARLKLEKGTITPEENLQLYAVATSIVEAEDPAKAIAEMKKNGVASPTSQAQLAELLRVHPEVLQSAVVETKDGPVVGKESVDAIIKNLKDKGILKTYNADPLGIGMGVNSDQALRTTLIDAINERTKGGVLLMGGKEVEFNPREATGKTPEVKFIAAILPDKPVETPAPPATEKPKDGLAVAAAAFARGEGDGSNLVGANSGGYARGNGKAQETQKI